MNGNAFDKRMAIFLAAVCGQTYVQFNDAHGLFLVPRDFKAVCAFEALAYNNTLERFGFILESDDTVIIAFRGTSSTADWVSDAIARQDKYKHAPDAGWTHSGITRIYNSARKKILAALSRLDPGKTLYITGHSLGGALAVLCAVDIAANTGFKSPGVYTYGSPRVGDSVFAKAFAERIGASHRIHNRFDLVTQPPLYYKSPKTGTLYPYIHVKHAYPLAFQKGSVPANHLLDNYFAELAALDPVYADELDQANPGFCPKGSLVPG
ncbi:lipase family protein [Paenibacillus sp. P25]|nr:lipase family protein [Paenibacillus sp. P25]